MTEKMLPICKANELDIQESEHSWLIQPLWANHAVGILGGPPKSYKSWVGLDMAVSVASASDKSISSFEFLAANNSALSSDVSGTVYENSFTVGASVPTGTDVTALCPTVGIAGDSVSPGNEVDADFTNSVAYTVTAADETTQDYTATVTVSSDTTTPTNPSISIDGGAASTTSTSVTLTLSANDNIGVVGYYASETNTIPVVGDSGWTSVTSTTDYSGSVSFTMSNTAATKTVYVWFKDEAGNISTGSNDSIFYNKAWTEATSAASWSGRQFPTSVVFDNKIWVVGGLDGTKKKDVWYSTDGANWTQATAAAAWSARNSHTTVAFDSKIWVIGGHDGGYKNDVWYSIDGTNWTEATSAASWPIRGEHASVVFDNKMWVVGGMDGSYKNDVWYSTDGINWTEATSAASWSARYYITGTVFDNKIWIAGGSDGSRLNDVWYSSDGASWTEATSAAPWVVRIAPIVSFDNKLWVIGGSGDSNKLNDVWYSTDGTNWTEATSAASWDARMLHGCVVFDDKIWVLGGRDDGLNDHNDVWYW